MLFYDNAKPQHGIHTHTAHMHTHTHTTYKTHTHTHTAYSTRAVHTHAVHTHRLCSFAGLRCYAMAQMQAVQLRCLFAGASFVAVPTVVDSQVPTA